MGFTSSVGCELMSAALVGFDTQQRHTKSWTQWPVICLHISIGLLIFECHTLEELNRREHCPHPAKQLMWSVNGTDL